MDFMWSERDRREIYRRGLAIRGIAAAAFLGLFVPVHVSGFGGEIQTLRWINATLLTLVAVNPLLWWIGKARGYPLTDFYVHWGIDILAVTVVVYCLGTLDVPLTIAAYMIMIVTSATYSSKNTSLYLAGSSAMCLTMLVLCEELSVIPHQHVPFASHLTPEGKAITVGASIILFFIFGYLAGSLAGQLQTKTVEINKQKDELESAYAKEQAAREGLTLLSALVQHDVYSPLGVISGACSEARRSCEEGDLLTSSKFISMIEQRLRSIESAVGTLGLFQVGVSEQEPDACDVRGLVNEVIEDLEVELQERRITIKLSGDWPVACVKREHLYHVVRNLVTNSMKSVDDDGSGLIDIIAKRLDDLGGGQLSVIDNGPGVAEETRKKLFMLNAPDRDTKPGSGFGAGLALCSNLVRNWGGQLSYQSAPGGGAEFTVSLPGVPRRTS
jgi:signal transduction histidine kinase